MIKLNCGVNRKVGEPNFSSRGASMNVEMELESSAAGDTQLLQDRMRRLFALAKSAVDEELGLREEKKPVAAPVAPAEAENAKGVPAKDVRPASPAQMRAIKSLCERLKLDPEKAVREKLHLGMAELTVPRASTMIDHLKSASASAK